MDLSEAHRNYLLDHAISDEVISSWPIHSVDEEIVFPWTDGDSYTEQRRPWPGEGGVYFWEAGKDLHFWTLRDAGPTAPVLLVEGTKQSLAAASWAPEGYTVMGMAGCWGWIHAKLNRFRGRELIVCLDADAASNLDVYEAGEKLAEKLKRYGVTPRFTRIPGTGSQGLDDYLADIDEDERTEILTFEINNAQAKPADRKPTSRKRKMESDMPDLGDRIGVAINLDRKMVIDKITDALKDRHDGRDLFNYGDVLTVIRGHETQPLDRDRFHAILVDGVACFKYQEATDKRPAIFEPAWPDSQSIGAIMSKADLFSPLKRVVRVPFLRPDGTVCTEAGYDRPTATVLVPSGIDDLNVPLEPTHEQTRMAAKFLLEDWLGDFPFESDADRANALAMLLTPFMRGTVPLAPLAVVNGLEAGVGKNLLADCAALLATGEVAAPLPYVANEEEMRKQLTAGFAGGAELFVFDEAHVIEGAQFSRAVTSLTYQDRVLGVSRMAQFPNQVTWMSLGNQVQVNGDMSRRVYFICLSPAGTTLADRESYAYRHPDLKAWTAEHRTELVSAALTVLRGWVAAGRPAYSRGASMGSFEPWDRFMSSVLAYAGVDGFLSDSRERRSESDFTNSYWDAHVHWLYDTFATELFTTRQVQEAALRDPSRYEAPPNLEDATGKSYTRELGKAYAKIRNRTYGSVRLTKAGIGHKSTLRWQIAKDDGGNGGNGGNPTPPLYVGNISDVDAPREDAPGTCARKEAGGGHPSVPSVPSTDEFEAASPVPGPVSLGFDLETASVEQLYLGGQEGPYVRLAGVAYPTGVTATDGGPDVVTEHLGLADEIYGHNILGFDIPALARHHGADYDALAAKAWDTQVIERLVDPPLSKGMPNGYYGLDATARRYGHVGKTDDVKALAKKHGGFDRIPLDDPEYNDYLRGDLAATKAVREAQAARVEELGLQAYAQREMRVAALQNRMTLNGWAVDKATLLAKVRTEAAQKAEAVKVLSEEFGVPLARPDRYKLKPKAEWPEEYQVGLSIVHAREGLKEDPERSVEAGLAVRIPGETYVSPWATDAGREALENAFRAAGANTWPTTPNGSLALSADALGEQPWYDTDARKSKPGMLQVHGDKPGVRRIVETVLRATGARDKYAEIAKFVTGDDRVHAWIGDTQASGRWAMTKPSITNMGKRGAAAEERSVMVADPGHLLVTCDLSQVDMRALAGLSQDPAYMELFAPGRNAHREMSVVYFGEATPETYDKTKAFNHAGNYGQGAKAVSERTGIPLDVCYEIQRAKAENYPVLAEWIDNTRALAERGMLLDNGFGRLMRPTPERAYTQGPALMGQGAARDIMCESLLRLADKCEEWERPVTPYLRAVVHDEVVLSVPEHEVAYWQAALQSAFTWEWKGVPILCELGTPAYRWSDCK